MYLCIISHHCNASESNFKENLGIQNILIHQKIVNSLLLAYATNVEVWDNISVISMMISLAAIWLVKNFWMIDISELWSVMITGRQEAVGYLIWKV